MLESYRV